MRNPALVKRYAEGLAAALKSEAEYGLVYGEIAAFARLLEDQARLRDVLLRPFLTTAKKASIVRQILEAEDVSPKTRRFLLLLIQHGRLEILSTIVLDLPDLWKERQGIRTFEVRSVVPLAGRQKNRLEEELGRLEKAPVHCTYRLDPGLVGGLVVLKGNLVYDVSLKGQLEKLKDVISER